MVPLVLAADLRTEIKVWVVSDRPVEVDDEAPEAEAGGEAGEGEVASEETQAAEA